MPKSDQAGVIVILDEVFAHNEIDFTNDVFLLEKKTDALVYLLYNLTEEK